MADDTRQRVLRAAAELIEEVGLDGFSIGELAGRSGSSNGSIYHHFGSKDGVLAELVIGALDDYADGVHEILEQSPRDAEAGIKSLVRNFVDWVEVDPPRARLLNRYRDRVAGGPRGGDLAARNREFLRAIAAWLDAAAERGEIPRLGIDLVYAIVIGPAQALTRFWLSGRVGDLPSWSSDRLAAAAWQGLLAAGTKEDRAR